MCIIVRFKSASQILADENEANMQAMLEETKRLGGGSEPLTEKQEALLLEKLLASHGLDEAMIKRASPDAVDEEEIIVVEEVVEVPDTSDDEDGATTGNMDSTATDVEV
eukprot:TRINITY_DN31821_c0_g1_i1.p1 TRINITY_DN31821_c0_g1~~TRINITY_DN31821_c0_g1_i1.p1  ORF type:complete len:109 (+),score=24.78 TRINITY_DN31821_c0_g1_i1:77-403(+)